MNIKISKENKNYSTKITEMQKKCPKAKRTKGIYISLKRATYIEEYWIIFITNKWKQDQNVCEMETRS